MPETKKGILQITNFSFIYVHNKFNLLETINFVSLFNEPDI